MALKEIRFNPEKGMPGLAVRDISMLKTLKHENILTKS
jgi:hypothetical protein